MCNPIIKVNIGKKYSAVIELWYNELSKLEGYDFEYTSNITPSEDQEEDISQHVSDWVHDTFGSGIIPEMPRIFTLNLEGLE